jgi:hypothetical protein
MVSPEVFLPALWCLSCEPKRSMEFFVRSLIASGPLAMAKSKNTSHGAPRPRRGCINIHGTACLHIFEGVIFRGYLSSVPMKLDFCVCSSAESPSLVATESLVRRQRFGHRPRHHDQKRANMFITGRRFRRLHRRPHRGFVYLPSVILRLRQRRTAPRGRTGLGTTIKNVRTC